VGQVLRIRDPAAGNKLAVDDGACRRLVEIDLARCRFGLLLQLSDDVGRGGSRVLLQLCEFGRECELARLGFLRELFPDGALFGLALRSFLRGFLVAGVLLGFRARTFGRRLACTEFAVQPLDLCPQFGGRVGRRGRRQKGGPASRSCRVRRLSGTRWRAAVPS